MAAPRPDGAGAARIAGEGLSTFAALVLAGVMMITVVDVFGRYLVNAPLPGSSELTEILMAVLVYAGLPIVSHRQAHITVDLLDAVTPRFLVPVRRVFVGLVSVSVMAVVSWRIWAYAEQLSGWGVTEYLHLPLAPFAYFMSVLAGLAAAVELRRLVRPRAEAAAPAS
jgi:TRAP-type C4-dicarboxylate transport system permease small subunit